MDPGLDWLETARRLGAAILLGALIGWQREHAGKPAGLKTHMIVSLGSASFMLVMLEALEGLGAHESVRIDPSRVIQGLVGGIGFPGAGAILRSHGSVEGLTTAATIWGVGAIGLACGIGSCALAALTAGAAFLVLLLVGPLERRFVRGTRARAGLEAREDRE